MNESRTLIADLVHRYSDSVTRFDPDVWSDTWSRDANWDLGKGRTFRGKDEIVAFWHSAMEALVIVVQMVHNGTITVDDSGKSGSGRWYVSEHLHRCSGAKDMLLAWYDDTYTYEDGVWRFSSRKLTRLYSGPADLSAAFTRPANSGWETRNADA
jgi:SnoaL-like domain